MSIFDTIISRAPIDKGWSGDKKYRVKCENGDVYLLRISPEERAAQREALYGMLKQVERLDIPMNRAVEWGMCSEGVYMLLTWIDGYDAEQAVPELPVERQYALGQDAGEILAKIHAIPAPASQEPWGLRFRRKALRKIGTYLKNPERFDGDGAVIEYVRDNLELLDDRPQSFQHGDYHIGNMMLENGDVTIIDFDRFDYGDPWEEFNRIVWCAQAAPDFARGMVDGYFGGEVPMEFWKLLKLYIGSNTLSSMYWAIPFGQEEIDVMRRQAGDVMKWYDGMKKIVPSWYLG